MYVTRFVLADGGETADFEYDTPKEAYEHARAFRKDTSGLYATVCVMDGETGEVWSCAAFVDRRMRERFDLGDRVRPAGEDGTFVVKKLHEKTAEADVAPEGSDRTKRVQLARLVLLGGRTAFA